MDAGKEGAVHQGDHFRRFARRTWLCVAIAALLVAATIGLLARERSFLFPADRNNRSAFTELYFDNAQPTTYKVGVPFVVRFSITNREGKRVAYHYRVTDTGASPPGTLVEGAAVLADGGTATVREAVTVASGSDQVRIAVVLEDQQQAISFVIERQR